MKFLHTSDWHLGKRLEGQSRIEEQKQILDEIVEISNRENIEIVLIAGDIFDSYNPSAEAEALFFDTMYKLTTDKNRAVVVISGNHDDEERLTASKNICDKLGIYLVGNHEHNDFVSSKNSIKLVSQGKGFLAFENSNKEQVYIDLLPYPDESRFKEKVNEEESFDDKVLRWINSSRSGNINKLPEILVGHFFTLGGEMSESERGIDLGGTRAVKNQILPYINYIALGHLHKRQVVSYKKNAYYSGAIASYAFDEAGNIEKSVNCFEIKNGETLNFKQIPITKNKKLARLSANNLENAYKLLKEYNDYYVELTLFLDNPLSSAESKKLKSDFSNILILKLEFNSKDEKIESKKSMSDTELFLEYYKSKFKEEPSKKLKEVALNLLLEATNETD